MFKKCKVVMLPTNQKAIKKGQIGLVIINNYINTCSNEELDNISIEQGDVKPQHLYIISDDEIKEGDWCINDNHDTLYQPNCLGDISNWNKVIATTDNLLTIKEYTGVVDESNGVKEYWNNQLPSPSQSFINKYISEYNKGNVIEDIMVEYSDDFKCEDGHIMGYKTSCVYPHCDKPNYNYLKVSKDNTITIKRIKDSWNREEVKSLIVDGMRFMNSYIINHNTLHGQEAKQVANNWVEENL